MPDARSQMDLAKCDQPRNPIGDGVFYFDRIRQKPIAVCVVVDSPKQVQYKAEQQPLESLLFNRMFYA